MMDDGHDDGRAAIWSGPRDGWAWSRRWRKEPDGWVCVPGYGALEVALQIAAESHAPAAPAAPNRSPRFGTVAVGGVVPNDVYIGGDIPIVGADENTPGED